jgi:uncharacterized glyoxalase superfamily protein PhnB
MTASVREVRGTVVPTLRYRDVPAAIDWLCAAFGFEKHLVVAADDGSVRYAQLAFGDGMIMLGSVEDSLDGLMTQPDQTGGLETQVCYLFVDDARAHCARAKAAGAAIVLDIEDETSDGRGYSCRDPEGHVWNFGTYDPRQRQSVRTPAPLTPVQAGVKHLAFGIGMLANAVTSIAFLGWLYAVTEHTMSVAYAAVPADAATRSERAAGELVDRSVRETREQLAREKGAKDAAERAARDLRDQLSREKGARVQAESAVAEARDQLARERSARAAQEPAANSMRASLQKAEQAAEDARQRLGAMEQAAQKAREEAAGERANREAAEKAAAEARDQLGKERNAKEKAEQSARQAREQTSKAPAHRPAPKVSGQSSGNGTFLWQ